MKEGNLSKDKDGNYIGVEKYYIFDWNNKSYHSIEDNLVPVHESTISQYTGYNEKGTGTGNREIYTGDLVLVSYDIYEYNYQRSEWELIRTEFEKKVVPSSVMDMGQIFDEERYEPFIDRCGDEEQRRFVIKSIKVVGNIFETLSF